MTQPAEPKRPRFRRWHMGSLALLTAISIPTVQGWEAIGKTSEDVRLERMHASPQWNGEGFENPEPLYNDYALMVGELYWGNEQTAPDVPIDVVRSDAHQLDTPPDSGLRVTWLGHSTTLIEIDGVRILTDPVFGQRTSPIPWLGPRRWYAPPIALDDLRDLDAVLISHDHYDHLDHPTIVALSERDVPFIAPLGVGAHLEYWGVSPDQIREFDWWESTRIGEVEVVCTPARHASGRHVFDRNGTLWASYALVGPEHRVFFSGDTGLFNAMRTIGQRYGPFDLTMIEVGAYGQAWPDWHIGPEQAVEAHQWLRGRALLPIHWGLFNLAYHGWTEPIVRTVAAAQQQGVTIVAPRPGESFEPTSLPELRPWWPSDVPSRSAEQYPIRSTAVHH